MNKTFRAALASAMLVLFSAGGFVASAQSTKVTGKVVDAPASASLTFSCLGYKEETVSINGRGVVDAVLRPDSFDLWYKIKEVTVK